MTAGGRNWFGPAVPSEGFIGLFLVRNAPHTADHHTNRRLDAALAREVEGALQDLVAKYRSGSGDDVRRRTGPDLLRPFGINSPQCQPTAELRIRVSEDSPQDTTQLQISADDSFGFFFELSSALGLCGFRIRSAELGESQGKIHDVLQVTEADGGAIRDSVASKNCKRP